MYPAGEGGRLQAVSGAFFSMNNIWQLSNYKFLAANEDILKYVPSLSLRDSKSWCHPWHTSLQADMVKFQLLWLPKLLPQHWFFTSIWDVKMDINKLLIRTVASHGTGQIQWDASSVSSTMIIMYESLHIKLQLAEVHSTMLCTATTRNRTNESGLTEFVPDKRTLLEPNQANLCLCLKKMRQRKKKSTVLMM